MASGKPSESSPTVAEGVQLTKGEDVDISSELKGYLTRPQGKPKGGLIFMSDMSGYSTSVSRILANNIAENGYTVLIPDFYRNKPWDRTRSPRDLSKPSMFSDAFEEWLASHAQDRVDADLDASLEYLRRRLNVPSVSVIGFCWGGYQVMLASRKSADKFKAAVGFYAVKLAPNMAEVALAMKTPTLLHFGEVDKVMPLDTIAEMEKVLKQVNRLVSGVKDDPSKLGGAPVRIKIFKGMDHAFAHRGDTSNPAIMAAAKEAFNDMYEWLEKYM